MIRAEFSDYSFENTYLFPDEKGGKGGAGRHVLLANIEPGRVIDTFFGFTHSFFDGRA